MTTSKKTTSTKTQSKTTKQPSAASSEDKDNNVAQVAFDRAKKAIPSLDDVATAATDVSDYVQDHTNVDLQRLADDASTFVRRNPGTSLAAAAGLGVLIGILAAKRS